MKRKILFVLVVALMVLSANIVAAQDDVTINILMMDQAAMQPDQFDEIADVLKRIRVSKSK